MQIFRLCCKWKINALSSLESATREQNHFTNVKRIEINKIHVNSKRSRLICESLGANVYLRGRKNVVEECLETASNLNSHKLKGVA